MDLTSGFSAISSHTMCIWFVFVMCGRITAAAAAAAAAAEVAPILHADLLLRFVMASINADLAAWRSSVYRDLASKQQNSAPHRAMLWQAQSTCHYAEVESSISNACGIAHARQMPRALLLTNWDVPPK